MKIISWNMAHLCDSWRCLLGMDIDLALLQEACKPPRDVLKQIADNPEIKIDPAVGKPLFEGDRVRPRTAIVKLSKNIKKIEWIEAKPFHLAKDGEFIASRPGTISAAIITPVKGLRLMVVSMYAQWRIMAPLAKPNNDVFADGSAHQLVSDMSTFVTSARSHRVIAAGDLNILRGYGEKRDPYWGARYKSVFDRLEVMGLRCVGPEFPNGLQANPWPKELPPGSKNVPTFRAKKKRPETAKRQLDFVFASTELAESLTVSALNAPDEWETSDHCRVEIELADAA